MSVHENMVGVKSLGALVETGSVNEALPEVNRPVDFGSTEIRPVVNSFGNPVGSREERLNDIAQELLETRHHDIAGFAVNVEMAANRLTSRRRVNKRRPSNKRIKPVPPRINRVNRRPGDNSRNKPR